MCVMVCENTYLEGSVDYVKGVKQKQWLKFARGFEIVRVGEDCLDRMVAKDVFLVSTGPIHSNRWPIVQPQVSVVVVAYINFSNCIIWKSLRVVVVTV